MQQKSNQGESNPAAELANPADEDASLATLLNQMTFKEREEAFLDVHCIPSVREETPELIEQGLQELKVCLSKIQPQDVPEQSLQGYQIVESRYPELLQSEVYMRKYLRAAQYDGKEAATRLVRHLEWKLKLFGEERLGVPVMTFDHLSEEDQLCFRTFGVGQILPCPDKAGRVVLFWKTMPHLPFPYATRNRIQFYMYELLSEIESVQLRGITCLVFSLGPGGLRCQDLTNRLRTGPLFVPMLLVKMSAFHFCSDDPERIVGSTLLKCMSQRGSKSRFRSHPGDLREILSSLATFGIPLGVLPLTKDGEVLVEAHQRWLENQIEKERGDSHGDMASAEVSPEGTPPISPNETHMLQEKQSEITAISMMEQVQTDSATRRVSSGESCCDSVDLTDMDVVCGKGRFIQELPGNEDFSKKIKVLSPEYHSLVSNQDKTHMTIQILKDIRGNGGRFLRKREDGKYEEVGEMVARQKVASAFRSVRKMKKRRKLREGQGSDESAFAPEGNGSLDRRMWLPHHHPV